MGELKNGALDFLVTEVQGSLADNNFVQEPLFRLRYALVSRAGESLSPDARLLRDETRAAMHEIGS